MPNNFYFITSLKNPAISSKTFRITWPVSGKIFTLAEGTKSLILFPVACVFKGLVLPSAIVGAGLCACPNGGNHRGIAPT